MNIYTAILELAIYQHNKGELAIGYIRYEAVRVLNPRQFAALYKLNIKGRRFDDLVDRLIEEGPGFLDEVEV